jgi:putative Mn2+ efflux pump MntP
MFSDLLFGYIGPIIIIFMGIIFIIDAIQNIRSREPWRYNDSRMFLPLAILGILAGIAILLSRLKIL